MADKLKKYICANKIKRAWRRCISDPSYLICRKRLLREYKNLI
jgi:hypothetical protein